MRGLILVRHAQAASNVDDVVSGVPPGGGLSGEGRAEAEALAGELARRRIGLGVSTRFLRTRETLQLALAGRPGVPQLVLPELDEIDFGGFEGGSLQAYREWAWTTEPDVPPPGGGESRAAVASRVADALEELLQRAEETILVVGHALPLRYVLDASDGRFPAARIERLAHATPYPLGRERVETAAETLRAWSLEPQFRDAVD